MLFNSAEYVSLKTPVFQNLFYNVCGPGVEFLACTDIAIYPLSNMPEKLPQRAVHFFHIVAGFQKLINN